MQKRLCVALGIIASTFSVSALSILSAKATEYPSRPITMVVPFTPGAGADQVMGDVPSFVELGGTSVAC